jgi:hypothetical protein
MMKKEPVNNNPSKINHGAPGAPPEEHCEQLHAKHPFERGSRLVPSQSAKSFAPKSWRGRITLQRARRRLAENVSQRYRNSVAFRRRRRSRQEATRREK